MLAGVLYVCLCKFKKYTVGKTEGAIKNDEIRYKYIHIMLDQF